MMHSTHQSSMVHIISSLCNFYIIKCGIGLCDYPYQRESKGKILPINIGGKLWREKGWISMNFFFYMKDGRTSGHTWDQRLNLFKTNKF